MSYLAASSTAAAAAAKSTPFIDWASLGKVAGVSFIFGVAIVVLFSVGIVGVSWIHGGTGADADSAGPASLAAIDAGAGGAAGITGSRPLGFALSGLCFAICGGAVLYGLYLIIPQFHK